MLKIRVRQISYLRVEAPQACLEGSCVYLYGGQVREHLIY